MAAADTAAAVVAAEAADSASAEAAAVAALEAAAVASAGAGAWAAAACRGEVALSARLKIGITNIDLFAEMTGIFHVDGRSICDCRRTNRGLQTDAPLRPGGGYPNDEAMAKDGRSNSDFDLIHSSQLYQDHRRPRASEAPPDATDSK